MRRVKPPLEEQPFVDRVVQWDDTDVYRAEDEIKSLMQHPGWVRVQGLLHTARDGALSRVIHGPTKTGKQYARDMGLLSGLELSGVAARAVLTAAESVRRQAEGTGDE